MTAKSTNNKTHIKIINEKLLTTPSCYSCHNKSVNLTYCDISEDKLDNAFMCVMDKYNIITKHISYYRSFGAVYDKYIFYTMRELSADKKYYVLFNKKIDYTKYNIISSVKKYLDIDDTDDIFTGYIHIFCDDFIYVYDEVTKILNKI
jgi:hypothetical protein